mmetsp:Transcript_71708/g.158431  ORF Transcript_71708/g.158431 Transcript_71708/m.158431 type:complete len:216 (-) Transcript_71708:49-696(-)
MPQQQKGGSCSKGQTDQDVDKALFKKAGSERNPRKGVDRVQRTPNWSTDDHHQQEGDAPWPGTLEAEEVGKPIWHVHSSQNGQHETHHEHHLKVENGVEVAMWLAVSRNIKLANNSHHNVLHHKKQIPNGQGNILPPWHPVPMAAIMAQIQKTLPGFISWRLGLHLQRCVEGQRWRCEGGGSRPGERALHGVPGGRALHGVHHKLPLPRCWPCWP